MDESHDRSSHRACPQRAVCYSLPATDYLGCDPRGPLDLTLGLSDYTLMEWLFACRRAEPNPRNAHMDVRMDLARIIIRDDDEQQIIVLAERDGERQFSIVVGLYEGWAIRRRVNGVESPRPMTHDLLANIIEDLDAELEKVVIHDIREHTFFAKLVIRRN
ncbi:MAG: bifunctional nuclease family protein, partial [Planctomycetota bacterium]|nr:bifunctional nuclease family protein [Planctomycetota bacterium]